MPSTSEARVRVAQGGARGWQRSVATRHDDVELRERILGLVTHHGLVEMIPRELDGSVLKQQFGLLLNKLLYKLHWALSLDLASVSPNGGYYEKFSMYHPFGCIQWL